MISESVLLYYFKAKSVICEQGYYPEIFFQDRLRISSISKAHYYREYAWVVLSSGMSEKVILSVFDKISEIFNHWQTPAKIITHQKIIQKKALAVFNNVLKIHALLDMASYLEKTTIEQELININKFGIAHLQKLKFIGPATVYHFAKNIGLNLAKPDRHLVRIANSFGYCCVNDFCEQIALDIGEKRSVVDLVLWRYATLNKNYLKEIEYV